MSEILITERIVVKDAYIAELKEQLAKAEKVISEFHMSDGGKFVTPPAVFMYMEQIEGLEKQLKQRDEIIKVLSEAMGEVEQMAPNVDGSYSIGSIKWAVKCARWAQQRVEELRGKNEKNNLDV